MFERFTSDSRRVLVVAAERCRAMGHFQITPAHLLLGLFEVPGSSDVLRESAGLSRQAFEEHLAVIWPAADHIPANPPFTSDAKKVLEEALRQALRLEHKAITPAHLLLALLTRPEGVDVEWLEAHAKGGLTTLHAAIEELRPTLAAHASTALGRVRSRTTIIEQPVTTAAREALKATEGTLDTGALLLSLAKQQGSAAAQALAKLGITADALAEAVSAVNTTGTTDEPPLPPAVRLVDQTGQSLLVEAGDLLRYAAERAADLSAQGLATSTTAPDGSLVVDLGEGSLTELLAGFGDWQAGRAPS